MNSPKFNTNSLSCLKKVLILCKTNLYNDPRVLKQINSLGHEYHITTAGTAPSNQPDVDVEWPVFTKDESLNKYLFFLQLITKQYRNIYWTEKHKAALEKLINTKFDLIICNETELLPIANEISKEQNISIYLDLHEYYPVDKKNGILSSLQKKYECWLLKNHLNNVARFSTVSPSIVKLYKKRFNIDCTLIDNACRYFDLSPTKTDPEHIKLVSHGAAIRGRKIEHMINMMKLMDSRYSLDLFLMDTDTTYRNELQKEANKFPIGKVNIYPGIPFSDIQKTINKYDVGIYSLYPTHLNNELALPNKLFEFIQGRVAIVIGPTPDMVDIVQKYSLGKVTKEFTPKSLAKTIQMLSITDIERYKRNTNIAAIERNSEVNLEEIRKIVSSILD